MSAYHPVLAACQGEDAGRLVDCESWLIGKPIRIFPSFPSARIERDESSVDDHKALNIAGPQGKRHFNRLPAGNQEIRLVECQPILPVAGSHPGSPEVNSEKSTPTQSR